MGGQAQQGSRRCCDGVSAMGGQAQQGSRRCCDGQAVAEQAQQGSCRCCDGQAVAEHEAKHPIHTPQRSCRAYEAEHPIHTPQRVCLYARWTSDVSNLADRQVPGSKQVWLAAYYCSQDVSTSRVYAAIPSECVKGGGEKVWEEGRGLQLGFNSEMIKCFPCMMLLTFAVVGEAQGRACKRAASLAHTTAHALLPWHSQQCCGYLSTYEMVHFSALLPWHSQQYCAHERAAALAIPEWCMLALAPQQYCENLRTVVNQHYRVYYPWHHHDPQQYCENLSTHNSTVHSSVLFWHSPQYPIPWPIGCRGHPCERIVALQTFPYIPSAHRHLVMVVTDGCRGHPC
eukprot:1142584-Pelagomonas_calceolata.AAC.1